MTYSLFAVTAPGLEEITKAELVKLGGLPNASIKLSPSTLGRETGGIEFSARPADLYRVNLHLRTASRIIARIGEFDAVGFEELQKKAARLGWKEFLRPGQPISINVTCHKSRLYHSAAVSREVAKAIARAMNAESPLVKSDQETEGTTQLIMVRLVNDHCTISIDTSGELLHRRGYRLETAKAPLRETLAAGLLLAAGYDGTSPLADPFCGSGTIAIEATLIARRIAPGKGRKFAFMNWPNYQKENWQRTIEEADGMETQECPHIIASDRDAGAIRMAQSNAARAGVESNIDFIQQAMSFAVSPGENGFIITNPPYGVRVSETKDLRNLYASLGDLIRERFAGYKGGILCNDPMLAGQTKIKFSKTLNLVNGGINVKYFMM